MKYFLTDTSNQVEHQRQNEPAIEKWLFDDVFCCSTRSSVDIGTDYNQEKYSVASRTIMGQRRIIYR